MREDYSTDGRVWGHFTHDDAVWRTYRWGEDGLLGFTDRHADSVLRSHSGMGSTRSSRSGLFGLAGHEGNHGEDVKECYFYWTRHPRTPTARALYKYPQAAFPYQALRDETASDQGPNWSTS